MEESKRTYTLPDVSGYYLTAAQYRELTDQLAAANKAVAALSEALEKYGKDPKWQKITHEWEDLSEITQRNHADAIKRARGE